jgi:hypothetical protein
MNEIENSVFQKNVFIGRFYEKPGNKVVHIQADSRCPFIRNFLISQNHINMKIGS